MKKILNFRPLLFLAVFLSVAVLSAYLSLESKSILKIIIPILAIIILFASCFIFSKNGKLKRNLIFACITMLLCALVFVNFSVRLNGYKSANLNAHVKTVTGRVSIATEEDYGQNVCLSNVKFNGKTSLYKVVVYVYGNIDLELGDKVEFTTNVLDFGTKYEGRFSSSYISEGIKYYCSISNNNISVIKGNKNVFEKTNLAIKNALKLGLSEREFAVAYAMLTGTTDYIDGTTLSGFRATGIAHIFAVSGLHAGFLAGALKFLFKKLKIKTKIRAPLIVSLLVFYAGVCGFTASVIRATVMTSVFLLSELKGSKYDSLSSLGLSAIIILFINPFQLFCVGFQLSFGVVLGILILSPVIKRGLKFLPNKLSTSLSSVIASFLSSFFICLSAFKNASIISVVANLIFIPVAGLVFVFLLISCILAMIFSPKIVLFLANYLLKAIILLVRSFDTSKLIVSGIFTGGFVVLYYLTLIISSSIVNLKATLKAIICSILSVVFIIGTTFTTIEKRQETVCAVNSSASFSSTLIDFDSSAILVISDFANIPNLNKLFKETERECIEHLDAVIILNGSTSKDCNFLLTRLNYKIKVKNFYVQDRALKGQFEILKSSFKFTNFYLLDYGEEFYVNETRVKNIMNGYGVKITSHSKNVSVLSRIDGVTLIPNDLNYSDAIIAFDRLDELYAKFSPEILVSYKYSSVFENADSSGNYKIKINKKGVLA